MRRRTGRRAWRETSNNWEAAWLGQMKAYNLPEPQREYPGIIGRRFRFDFAWPSLKVAAECEGGIWMKRGPGHSHGSPQGISRDIEKHNLAALQGWRVIRATSTQIRDGIAIRWLAAALGVEIR